MKSDAYKTALLAPRPSDVDFVGDDLALAAGSITLADNPLLANVDGLGALVETSSLTVTRNKALQSLALPALAAVGGITQVMQNTGLQSVSLPVLAAGGATMRVTQNPVLTSVVAPQVATLSQDLEVLQNPDLTTLDLSALRSVGRHLTIRFVAVPTLSLPSLASVRRLTMRKRVDLPAPERPMMPIMHGLSTSSEAASTAVFSPNRFVSFSIRSTSHPQMCWRLAKGGVQRLCVGWVKVL